MTFTIIAMGKLKESYLSEGCDEYLKRLSGFSKTKVIQLDPVRLPDDPSDKQIRDALDKEGERILSRIPGNAFVCALCIEGNRLSTPKLVELFCDTLSKGRSEFIFIIGSSYGLSEKVKSAADFRLSMSDMTFPHQLARLMLLEQLYRACTILENRKYHK